MKKMMTVLLTCLLCIGMLTSAQAAQSPEEWILAFQGSLVGMTEDTFSMDAPQVLGEDHYIITGNWDNSVELTAEIDEGGARCTVRILFEALDTSDWELAGTLASMGLISFYQAQRPDQSEGEALLYLLALSSAMIEATDTLSYDKGEAIPIQDTELRLYMEASPLSMVYELYVPSGDSVAVSATATPESAVHASAPKKTDAAALSPAMVTWIEQYQALWLEQFDSPFTFDRAIEVAEGHFILETTWLDIIEVSVEVDGEHMEVMTRLSLLDLNDETDIVRISEAYGMILLNAYLVQHPEYTEADVIAYSMAFAEGMLTLNTLYIQSPTVEVTSLEIEDSTLFFHLDLSSLAMVFGLSM